MKNQRSKLKWPGIATVLMLIDRLVVAWLLISNSSATPGERSPNPSSVLHPGTQFAKTF